ncbi:endonuclease/exonuclease/phosphatase family protein [Amnibacterium kyonggiense]
MRSSAASPRPKRAVRTAVRVALAGLALSGLALAALVGPAAPPASAATRIGLTVVGGDRQISAAWGAVPGATGYVVHWGKGTKTNRTVRTTATSIRIPSVANRTAYSVQVTAVGVGAASSRVAARAVPYVPTSISKVTAVPAGPNSIRVSWTGGTQARSVAVIAGADSMTTTHHFSTGWMPAAVRSTVVTVPASLRGVLGAGTGNVVFLKVVLSNSTAKNPVKHLTFSLKDKYRLTPSGTWSLAGAPAVSGPSTRLTVASWNVQSITASSAFQQNTWATRLPKVVANIESLHPALLGLQELTTARVDPKCLNPRGSFPCTEQYQTLERALQSAAVPYRFARDDANAWLYTRSGSVYVDSALVYDPSRLTVEQSGFISPKTLVGSAWPSSMADEAGMWARFRTVPTGDEPARSFYAVSIHLPAGSNGTVRMKEAAAVASFMDAKAKQADGTSLPVVVTGDFNAYGALDPLGGSLRLLAAGYVDTAAVSDRTGMRYSTSNSTNGVDAVDDGYPAHVEQHPYPTSRIDYIMIKNSPHLFSYQNVVRAGVKGLMQAAYQGSDHNLQLATIGIGDPVPSR